MLYRLDLKYKIDVGFLFEKPGGQDDKEKDTLGSQTTERSTWMSTSQRDIFGI